MALEPRTWTRGVALTCGALLAAAALTGCFALGESVRMPAGVRYAAGRDFLVGRDPETPGYGLYSYLLLGGAPAPAARARCLQAVVAYLEYLPPIADLQQQVPRERLNVTYVPVTERPPPEIAEFRPTLTNAEKSAAAATWILDHYAYARAAALLAALGPTSGDGPLLVSALHPLSGGATVGPHVRQDLSRVPPDFARAWVREFLRDAASPEDWNRGSLQRFALTLRTEAAAGGTVLPVVRDSVREWIKFID